ncbi:hypothetical protein E4U40_003630 [Claviceps sp. LM458 group G5]|nr:hypothetical protein E4U40_003630 [Claviceps sp. LM458 group G5]
MNLFTAAIFSMAVVPVLADDTKDYILTCLRGMYRQAARAMLKPTLATSSRIPATIPIVRIW